MRVKAFVDTNIWLYALVKTSADDPHHHAASHFLDRLPRPVISTQVIKEAVSNLIKKANMPELAIRKLVADWYKECDVHACNEGQIIAASWLREKYSFSHWDSLIVASAIDAGCDVLYSEDLQDGLRVNDQLSVANPLK